MKLSPLMIALLNKCNIENNQLTITEQLQRKEYLELNKVLESIGGKWNKKLKVHTFEDDNIEDIVLDILNTGEYTNQRKEFDFFPTPSDIVQQMIDLAGLKAGMNILEPSAGDGSIVSQLISHGLNIEAYEINPKMEKYLSQIKEKEPEFQFTIANFLNVNPVQRYDRVLMNPPFSKQQDLDHVQHALKFLKPNGTLIAIMSESAFFRENNKTIHFWSGAMKNRKMVSNNKLESGSFRESGTMVRSRIIEVQ